MTDRVGKLECRFVDAHRAHTGLLEEVRRTTKRPSEMTADPFAGDGHKSIHRRVRQLEDSSREARARIEEVSARFTDLSADFECLRHKVAGSPLLEPIDDILQVISARADELSRRLDGSETRSCVALPPAAQKPGAQGSRCDIPSGYAPLHFEEPLAYPSFLYDD